MVYFPEEPVWSRPPRLPSWELISITFPRDLTKSRNFSEHLSLPSISFYLDYPLAAKITPIFTFSLLRVLSRRAIARSSLSPAVRGIRRFSNPRCYIKARVGFISEFACLRQSIEFDIVLSNSSNSAISSWSSGWASIGGNKCWLLG